MPVKSTSKHDGDPSRERAGTFDEKDAQPVDMQYEPPSVYEQLLPAQEAPDDTVPAGGPHRVRCPARVHALSLREFS